MSSFEILVGARGSQLSRAQLKEVADELKKAHPEITLKPKWVETTGDKDLKTSLRTLEKTDFFTKEIDELLLSGGCRIAIHSAKDLPDPLPKGIAMIALTQGVDAGDSLVLREGEKLEDAKMIGTSCERRENTIHALRPDLKCIDIRGPIESRLKQLKDRKVDGVVIAEAAIIRLKLQHLNRIKLEGETAPLQGKLAVLAREGDEEMRTLFASLDRGRKKVLYLGLDPTHFRTDGKIIHYPVIKIKPRKVTFDNLKLYTHIIFTSKTAVKLFFQNVKKEKVHGKIIIAIGSITAFYLKEEGFVPDYIAREETQEGVIALLDKIDLKQASLFVPRSSLSRPLIVNYLKKKKVCYHVCDLYDTISQKLLPVPDLAHIDEIVFTSPSTIEAFLKIYPEIPKEKTLIPIGPVTSNALESIMVQKP